MRILRANLAGLAAIAGIAALAIASSGGAFAAKSVGGPVCGLRADGPKNYDSARAAKADHAAVMHQGACVIFCQGAVPVLVAQPMCGMDPLNHARITYRNNCEAENAHAIWVHNGPCK